MSSVIFVHGPLPPCHYLHETQQLHAPCYYDMDLKEALSSWQKDYQMVISCFAFLVSYAVLWSSFLYFDFIYRLSISIGNISQFSLILSQREQDILFSFLNVGYNCDKIVWKDKTIMMMGNQIEIKESIFYFKSFLQGLRRYHSGGDLITSWCKRTSVCTSMNPSKNWCNVENFGL